MPKFVHAIYQFAAPVCRFLSEDTYAFIELIRCRFLGRRYLGRRFREWEMRQRCKPVPPATITCGGLIVDTVALENRVENTMRIAKNLDHARIEHGVLMHVLLRQFLR